MKLLHRVETYAPHVLQMQGYPNVSMMGNLGEDAEHTESEETVAQLTQVKQSIGNVLQRLSDKHSSGYESERDSESGGGGGSSMERPDPRVMLDSHHRRKSFHASSQKSFSLSVMDMSEYEHHWQDPDHRRCKSITTTTDNTISSSGDGESSPLVAQNIFVSVMPQGDSYVGSGHGLDEDMSMEPLYETRRTSSFPSSPQPVEHKVFGSADDIVLRNTKQYNNFETFRDMRTAPFGVQSSSWADNSSRQHLWKHRSSPLFPSFSKDSQSFSESKDSDESDYWKSFELQTENPRHVSGHDLHKDNSEQYNVSKHTDRAFSPADARSTKEDSFHTLRVTLAKRESSDSSFEKDSGKLSPFSASSDSEHKDSVCHSPLYNKSFKKYLHQRYLSESQEERTDSVSDSDNIPTSFEHDDQVSIVTSSLERFGKDDEPDQKEGVSVMSNVPSSPSVISQQISIKIKHADDEDYDDNNNNGDEKMEDINIDLKEDDVFTASDNDPPLIASPRATKPPAAGFVTRRQEEPLDLTHAPRILPAFHHILSPYCYRHRYRSQYPLHQSREKQQQHHTEHLQQQHPKDDMYLHQHSPMHHTTLPLPLSPASLYQRSPSSVIYSPQVSPHSPLWAVPEGHIFNFNIPHSPFDNRSHSDPEFLSPGLSPAFSPDSPGGLRFKFPPRLPTSPLDTHHDSSTSSKFPKSPRLIFPSNLTPPYSPVKRTTVPHVFCSPPTPEQLRISLDGPGGTDLRYVCPVCGQVFPSYDNLAKHMAKHLPTETIKSEDNNKIHYCKVCNRAFSRSDMLTRHMRLHTGLKPYECRVCGQVFSRSDHLNTHQRTHSGIKPYHCPQCPYAACRRDMITRHMRIHTKRTNKRNTSASGAKPVLTSASGAGSTSSKYLSVPETDLDILRKSSVSSTDTADSQDHSIRTGSLSSMDSFESDTRSRNPSLTSSDSLDREGRSSVRHWSVESTDLDESKFLVNQSSVEVIASDSSFLSPNLAYRCHASWSSASFESLETGDSEGSFSKSMDDDKPCSDYTTHSDSPVIDEDSMRRITLSSDQNIQQ